MFFKQLNLNYKGFSLLELLTAAGLTATLAVVGIKSYRSQVNKTRTAEAQSSLSYVFSGQQTFYNSWNSYHENLVIVGLKPSGLYNYDVGFANTGHTSGGDIGNYPDITQKALTVKECFSFYGICEGDCIDQMEGHSSYFGDASINCEVSSTRDKKDTITACNQTACTDDAKVGESSFKAIAIEKLKEMDIWSIDETQKLRHELDGTDKKTPTSPAP